MRDRELRERIADSNPQRAKVGEFLNPLVIGVNQRHDHKAELGQCPTLDRAATKVGAELVMRDAKHPRDRFALTATTELRPVREGSRERLGDEINRDICLQGPPREEPQNPRGLRFIKAGKIFWLKRHRTV